MKSIKGTPLYLAPEMFTDSQYTHAADVWGLGALLFELGKGTPPFYAENLAALASKIVGEPVDLGGEAAFSAGLRAFHPEISFDQGLTMVRYDNIVGVVLALRAGWKAAAPNKADPSQAQGGS